MMVILPRVIHRIPIDPRTIFRQTFHWLRDCFPVTDTALLNGGVTPTLLVETAGGLGEGAVGRDDRDHQTEWERIHGRKYVPEPPGGLGRTYRAGGGGLTPSVLSCVWLFCDLLDYSSPGSSVCGILQARTLQWVAISPPGDLPILGIEPVSLMSPALATGFFTTSATWEASEFICLFIWLCQDLRCIMGNLPSWNTDSGCGAWAPGPAGFKSWGALA